MYQAWISKYADMRPIEWRFRTIDNLIDFLQSHSVDLEMPGRTFYGTGTRIYYGCVPYGSGGRVTWRGIPEGLPRAREVRDALRRELFTDSDLLSVGRWVEDDDSYRVTITTTRDTWAVYHLILGDRDPRIAYALAEYTGRAFQIGSVRVGRQYVRVQLITSKPGPETLEGLQAYFCPMTYLGDACDVCQRYAATYWGIALRGYPIS